ncbi:fibrobacter succinogenes major paralogous domain-containing protein [Elizabethkingia ursingii]|uniref:fibrobacter succinogenes major paralogous domain-containing protein n=1 Tax=Elizabethkingia ursingii TaxID=1756150 RepID=UPI002011543C|nr:fibrobacter succinogenes major paralogous domain-containing protein [Elizabethkingia ursingii]MCL1665809.1 fibrobacter succinogenes major paralogous domain-containing protein [Elizabethkingia ursingii]
MLNEKQKSLISRMIFMIVFMVFFISLLSLSSCRTTDHENITSGGRIAAVKINLLGTEYANSDEPTKIASINQKEFMEANRIQRYNVLLSPSSLINAELAPVRILNTVTTTSKNLNTKAAVLGNPIGEGIKFRVIAYKQNNGSYQIHQDYTVGQQAVPLMLDDGVTYDIIVYSYGANTLPNINTNEQTNIGNAKINYDSDNRDLMYQRISSFIPNGNSANNSLNIKLKHKIPNLTITLKSNSIISSVSNALIGNNYANAKLSLQSGGMTDWGSPNKVNVNFPSGSSNSLVSSPVFVNNDTNKGLFSADITVAGITKTIDLVDAFKIIPEYKSNLTINLKTCGAYIGSNTNPANYKEFMCQNLGATEGVDPFSPEAGNHGAKYQWGAKTGEVGRYVSQADDQSKDGDISGWENYKKPVGSWSDNSKTENDPCPSGYRMPTVAQWQGVISNNNVERVGGTWANDKNNYTTALYFRSPSNMRTLMLPVAGDRNSVGGGLSYRGMYGFYWSSSGSESYASYLSFSSGSVSVYNDGRTEGYSVRCIKE